MCVCMCVCAHVSNDTSKGLVSPLGGLLVILALRAILVQQHPTLCSVCTWQSTGPLYGVSLREAPGVLGSRECMFSREFTVFLQRKSPTCIREAIKNREDGMCKGSEGKPGVPQSGQRRPLWGQDLPWAWKGKGAGTF